MVLTYDDIVRLLTQDYTMPLLSEDNEELEDKYKNNILKNK